MTELETIERAKMYLDKLANGIDPLTDLPVAEDDVVNQVRISRCLFFVSDVLRRVLENGGITASKPVKKRPFFITQEELAQVVLSEAPVRATELCQSITKATGREDMTALAASTVLDWLESIGMVVKILGPDGKNSRRPTAEGVRLGIFEEPRTGMRGDYIAVLYDPAAQSDLSLIISRLSSHIKTKNDRYINTDPLWWRSSTRGDFLLPFIDQPLGNFPPGHFCG